MGKRLQLTAWSLRFGSIPSCRQMSTVSLKPPLAFCLTAFSASMSGRIALRQTWVYRQSTRRRSKGPCGSRAGFAEPQRGSLTTTTVLRAHRSTMRLSAGNFHGAAHDTGRTRCPATHDFVGFTSFGKGMGTCGSGAAAAAASCRLSGATSDGRCATLGLRSGAGASTCVTSCRQSEHARRQSSELDPGRAQRIAMQDVHMQMHSPLVEDPSSSGSGRHQRAAGRAPAGATS